MSKLNLYLVIALLVISATLTYSILRTRHYKANYTREAGNVVNMANENKVLVVTVQEWKTLSGEFKDRIDSLLKVLKVKPRQAKQVTVIETVYRDTGTVKIVYRDAVAQGNQFKVPVSYENQCWGFAGEIVSIDPTPEFKLTEQMASNEASLIITKQRRFLWVLWVTRPERYQVTSDCSSVRITEIQFVKK